MTFRILAALAIVLATSAHAGAEEVTRKWGDITLNANLELAEGKTLADGVMLMTHGTLAHGRMEIMKTLQGLFKEYGHSTLAITLSLGEDNRHGMFDCAAPHKHKHTDALDEIGAWLEWLKEKGAKKIVMLGHSRGGNQTAWFVTERDDPAIEKIVLIAPMTWTQAETEEGYEARYGKELNPILRKARAMIKEGKGAETLEHTDFLYCNDATVSAEAFVSYYSPDPRFDTPLLLRKVAKPALVFAGSQDTAVKNLPEKIRARKLEDSVRLVEIDGADHFFRDLFAYDIVETTVEFLKD